ncbi:MULTISPECIES: protoporphyrinogen/coproporphyrinogen oxidase [unclassified Streptomyces]|uniref:protoporphyrinogen/coproporphyrinogen oxidase n=1 Tax=unclassified Streptomyces TaxID=2593676 RepID=UPI003801EECB
MWHRSQEECVADNRQHKNVVVVGSGIAGTTAAFRLRRAGHHVTLLEREGHVGGRMSTREVVGERATYRIDRGASWLSHNYGPMIALLQDAGLTSRMLSCSDELAILRDGRVHRLSLVRTSGLLRTGLLGWRAKLKAVNLLRDLTAVGRRLRWEDMSGAADLDTESAHDHALRRLNRELLDYLVEPLCSTQFLVPAEEVAAVSAFCIMWGTFGAASFTFDGGVGRLPEDLLATPVMRDGTRLELDAEATAVEPDGAGVRVTWRRAGREETLRADACVVAVPAPVAARIVTTLTAAQRRHLEAVRYTSDVHVTFGLDRAPAETALGVAVPRREHPDLCVALYEHNLGPGRAPAGAGLVSLVFRHHWSTARADRGDEEVIADARGAVGEVLPELAAHIDRHRDLAVVQRWQNAVLARPAGGFRDLARFTASLDPASPVQLAGDYFAYSTTNAALATGEQAAERLRTTLAGV